MPNTNEDAVRRLFLAVERRDLAGVLAAYAPDVVIHEAESLPYGGRYRGLAGAEQHAYAYEDAWAPLQPPGVRKLDAEVLAAGDGVVVIWRQRGEHPLTGATFDAPAVSVYRMRGGLIAHSRMFQHDAAAVARFLGGTGGPGAVTRDR
jgi:hypothetical protein